MAIGPFVGPDQIHQPSGLTRAEVEIMDHLIEAWSIFVELDERHPDRLADFRRGIHDCQRILASRVLARTFPKYWR